MFFLGMFFQGAILICREYGIYMVPPLAAVTLLAYRVKPKLLGPIFLGLTLLVTGLTAVSSLK